MTFGRHAWMHGTRGPLAATHQQQQGFLPCPAEQRTEEATPTGHKARMKAALWSARLENICLSEQGWVRC